MEMKQTPKIVVGPEKARRAFQRGLDCRKNLEERMKRSYEKNKDPLGGHSNDQLKAMMESCRTTLKLFWEQRIASAPSPLFANPYKWSDDYYLGAIGFGSATAFFPGPRMFDCLIALSEPEMSRENYFARKDYLVFACYDWQHSHADTAYLIEVLHPEAIGRLARALDGHMFCLMLRDIDAYSGMVWERFPCQQEETKKNLLEKVAAAVPMEPFFNRQLAVDDLAKDAVRILRKGGEKANAVADMIVRWMEHIRSELEGMLREIRQKEGSAKSAMGR
ncbi:MAG: hypothetical protein AB1657_05300 [Candidatus Micrarchaeota archaeon]